MKTVLKKLLSTKLKRNILYFTSRDSLKLPEGARAFIFLAADYGNIGDLAITAAQKQFLQNHAGDRQVVRVPISRTAPLIRYIRKHATRDDLITIIGGGNMGVMYPDIEELRQRVIKSFPNNRIVCFPQTLDWKEDASSATALNQIQLTYSKHNDLHIFARESVSFKKLDELFAKHPNVNIEYSPDIVLSTTASNFLSGGTSEPAGILQALRNDRERILTTEQQQSVTDALTKTKLPIIVTDTHEGGSGLEQAVSDQMLANKVKEFCEAELVVTDRLHGMILAAISGTPCLVVPSSSHKLYQTWLEWLAEVPHVGLLTLEEMPSIAEAVQGLLSGPRHDQTQHIVDAQAYAKLRQVVS